MGASTADVALNRVDERSIRQLIGRGLGSAGKQLYSNQQKQRERVHEYLSQVKSLLVKAEATVGE
jgi:hypothetical protein